MDTSDPEITFDANGVCHHCRSFDRVARPILSRARSPEGERVLRQVIDEVKGRGHGRQYDCIIGVSGGVDSTYVAWLVKRMGLRPLAVHFDSGWNSELAVSNIENIVKKLDIDLHTFVVDWEEMADLQLAFFKASLANCDIPTDHGFLSVLYREAVKLGIKTFINGCNVATEFILPRAWGYNAGDLRHLREVHKRFGTRALRNYPTLPFFSRYIWYPYIRGIHQIRLLDLVPYSKQEAKQVIQQELGWRDYGGKHYESVFTRFFQAYYLPHKFGFDKRKAHLSNLVLSGQISREAAALELQQPTAPADLISRDKAFIAKKLGVSLDEFEMIIGQPPRRYDEFPSNEWIFRLKDRLRDTLRIKRGALRGASCG